MEAIIKEMKVEDAAGCLEEDAGGLEEEKKEEGGDENEDKGAIQYNMNQSTRIFCYNHHTTHYLFSNIDIGLFTEPQISPKCTHTLSRCVCRGPLL